MILSIINDRKAPADYREAMVVAGETYDDLPDDFAAMLLDQGLAIEVKVEKASETK